MCHLCYARCCRRADPVADILIAQRAFAAGEYGVSLFVYVKHRISTTPVGQISTGIKQHVNPSSLDFLFRNRNVFVVEWLACAVNSPFVDPESPVHAHIRRLLVSAYPVIWGNARDSGSRVAGLGTAVVMVFRSGLNSSPCLRKSARDDLRALPTCSCAVCMSASIFASSGYCLSSRENRILSSSPCVENLNGVGAFSMIAPK